MLIFTLIFKHLRIEYSYAALRGYSVDHDIGSVSQFECCEGVLLDEEDDYGLSKPGRTSDAVRDKILRVRPAAAAGTNCYQVRNPVIPNRLIMGCLTLPEKQNIFRTQADTDARGQTISDHIRHAPAPDAIAGCARLRALCRQGFQPQSAGRISETLTKQHVKHVGFPHGRSRSGQLSHRSLDQRRGGAYRGGSKGFDKLRAKGKDIDFDELLKMEPDGGTTNVRNTASRHWKRWLGVENRCVAPVTRFSEPDPASKIEGGRTPYAWFAGDETEPLMAFAGIWVQNRTSVRKVKEGLVTADLFAFLTTTPNGIVGPIHPKAMPAILKTSDEVEAWLTLPWEEAKVLQRPLPDDELVRLLA